MMVVSCTAAPPETTGDVPPTTRSSTPTADSTVTTGAAVDTTVQTTTTATAPLHDPFAGLSWPGGPVPVDAFLYDDGSTLYSIGLDGQRTVLWEHPPVAPSPEGLQAAPDGTAVAMAVYLDAATEQDASGILYLLQQDGSIDVVDVTYGFTVVESPMFIRPPTEPDLEPQLYWLRFLGEIDDDGRLGSHVITLTDTGPQEVTVPLRNHEAVFGLYSYPGAATFVLSLFRQNDTPTRLELLHNKDYYLVGANASRLLWSNNEPRVNTDGYTGVAWVNPHNYVLTVSDESVDGDTIRLVRFEMGCEWYGGQVVYQGDDIGRGVAETVWHLTAPDDHQVLALTRHDEIAIANQEIATAPWVSIDLDTGTITPTNIEWAPGAWTWVHPTDWTNPSTEETDCGQ